MGRNQKKTNTLLKSVEGGQAQRELSHLLDIGSALSAEHESNKVLDMILEKATETTSAEGASIFITEKVKQDSLAGAMPQYTSVLRFTHALNLSLKEIDRNVTLPMDNKSIAGYVASTGQSVRVRDAYALPADSPFQFNSEIDKHQGYRTKSVLAVPIKTSRGRVLGVVQLVNKTKSYRRADDPPEKKALKRASEKEIIAFSDHDDKLMHALASHAAVALENAKLTEDISNLFESFVKASVTAIEARDPSTSGHSDRVAALTVRFAEVLDQVKEGPYRDIKFTPEQIREIRYASLLHDFGKIGVRENVLLKAQKLFPHELETIFLRLTTIKSMNEAKVWRACVESFAELLQASAKFDPNNEIGKSLLQIDHFERKIEQIRKGILKANESQILDRDFDIRKLMDEIKRTGEDIGQKILSEPEIAQLSIARGTLGAEERKQIESHVSHTYEFLSQIAWTDSLQSVPDIAHAHHEKLDGTGYPRRLKADQIPVQSRMMTISDIYDALTAFDRPYKKAVDNTRALDILNSEANDGKLDKELLKLFIEARIFEVTIPTKRKKAA